MAQMWEDPLGNQEDLEELAWYWTPRINASKLSKQS
jgi:hypothetical protein